MLRYPLTIPQQAPQDSEDAFKRWPIIVEDGGAEAVKKFILENKPLYVKL